MLKKHVTTQQYFLPLTTQEVYLTKMMDQTVYCYSTSTEYHQKLNLTNNMVSYII